MNALEYLLLKATKNADGSLTVSRDLLKEVKARQSGENQVARRQAMRQQAAPVQRGDDE